MEADIGLHVHMCRSTRLSGLSPGVLQVDGGRIQTQERQPGVAPGEGGCGEAACDVDLRRRGAHVHLVGLAGRGAAVSPKPDGWSQPSNGAFQAYMMINSTCVKHVSS